MKNFLTSPFSNAVAFFIGVVLAALIYFGGASSADLAPLALGGGASNFSIVQVGDGSASAPSLSFTDDSNTGFYRIGTDNVGWTAGGVLAFDINSDGTVDFVGAQSYTGAATFASTVAQTLVNAAGGSANPYDYTGSLGIFNGSDDFTLFDVNLTNANHTSTGNTVTILDIANITGDTEATEVGARFGSGWDLDIGGTTSLELGADNTVVATIKDPAAIDAGTTTDSLEVALTTPADTTGTNTHNAIDVAVTVGNATGGTNAINAINITAVTGDAQSTEYGLNVGTGFDRGINVAGGGAVIVGTFTVDTGEIGAAEIANISRTVDIPILALIDCQTAAGAVIGFDTTADALPDYVVSSQTLLLRFDDTGGSEDEESEVCGAFTVPADYASGGVFIIMAKKDAHAGATETIACAVSVNGAALEAEGTVNTSASAATAYTCQPTIAALAAGNSVQFYLEVVSATTMDDVVDFLSIQFSYTATE